MADLAAREERWFQWLGRAESAQGTRTGRARTNAERCRAYRERLKRDPEAREEWKMRQRESERRSRRTKHHRRTSLGSAVEHVTVDPVRMPSASCTGRSAPSVPSCEAARTEPTRRRRRLSDRDGAAIRTPSIGGPQKRASHAGGSSPRRFATRKQAATPHAPRFREPWLSGAGRPYERGGGQTPRDVCGNRLARWWAADGRLLALPAFWSDERLTEVLGRELSGFERRRAEAWRAEHALRMGRHRLPETYRAFRDSGFDEGVRVSRELARLRVQSTNIRSGVAVYHPARDPGAGGSVRNALDSLRNALPGVYGEPRQPSRAELCRVEWERRTRKWKNSS